MGAVVGSPRAKEKEKANAKAETLDSSSALKVKELSLLQKKLSKPVRYSGQEDTREAYALM